MRYYVLYAFLLFTGSFLSSGFVFSQRTISGTLTNDKDTAILAGVIQLKGTNISKITDFFGKYTITVPDTNSVLIFSCIGFQTKEIVVGNNTKIDVKLRENNVLLHEVVITGNHRKKLASGLYGIMAKKRGKKVRKKKRRNRESYTKKEESGFSLVSQNPLSTFSIDVDRASYSNVRRFLNQGEMPPQDAVRIEEMLNYFNYDYQEPTRKHPFGVTTEYGNCTWNEAHKLVLIGLQAKKIKKNSLPNSNLVFLVDVSGSMSEQNKLPLLKKGLIALVKELRDQDKVSIVVYAGAAGVILPSTSDKTKIINALDHLEAGGSTAGGEGIELAYKIAQESFIKGGSNRIILCTDGDFNVGLSSDGEMKRLITEKRKSGIFLTCLGFGMGNYRDSKLEMLANKGNGNYAYIDNFQEARKVLVTEFAGTLFTLAKDVKMQIEFNPTYVAAYRLIGYENRLLNEEDFDDDTKDAGEIGAGHCVTALYEIIPKGVKSNFLPKTSTKLKYQKLRISEATGNQELMTVKFRYKKPNGIRSKKFEQTVVNEIEENNSNNFVWANAVATLGMILTDSKYKKKDDSDLYEWILKNAIHAKAHDEDGYRGEFIRLVKTAQTLEKSK